MMDPLHQASMAVYDRMKYAFSRPEDGISRKHHGSGLEVRRAIRDLFSHARVVTIHPELFNKAYWFCFEHHEEMPDKLAIRLPFNPTLFLVGSGIETDLLEDQFTELETAFGEKAVRVEQNAITYGWLISAGHVIEIGQIMTDRGPMLDSRFLSLQDNLTAPLFTLAFVLAHMEQDRLPLEVSRIKRQMAWKKVGGKGAPPPFYEVHPSLFYRPPQERKGGPERDVEWSHRWDVSAHTRMLVRRGPMPMANKKQIQLRRMGWKVFLGQSDEADRLLKARAREPMKEQEWCALKIVNVSAHVRGPDDKPYVPALRKVEGLPVESTVT